MFDNIGNKIKTLAAVLCWIGIVGCIITGIVFMATDEEFVLIGILISVVGSLLSWTGSFVMYGFGQLVENSDILVRQNQKTDTTKPTTATQNSEQKSEPTKPIVHKWRCDSCHNVISTNPCPYCGNNVNASPENEKKGLSGFIDNIKL